LKPARLDDGGDDGTYAVIGCQMRQSARKVVALGGQRCTALSTRGDRGNDEHRYPQAD